MSSILKVISGQFSVPVRRGKGDDEFLLALTISPLAFLMSHLQLKTETENSFQAGADFDVFVGEPGETGRPSDATRRATIMPLDSTPRSLRGARLTTTAISANHFSGS